jgi:AbrB family looped-hinge helix DNA binding protein
MVDYKKTVRIDDLGRVVIPAVIRRKLNIEPLDKLDVSLDGYTINIVKTDTSYIENYINDIKYVASDSYNLTTKEYRLLCEILNKLQAS